MLIKTAQLIGPALGWAVAKARGATFKPDSVGAICAYIDGRCIGGFHTKKEGGSALPNPSYRPYEDAGQGFPLMDERGIWLKYLTADDPAKVHCEAISGWFPRSVVMKGPYGGPGGGLVAGMRCIVAIELGDEVEVPDELVHEQPLAPVPLPERRRERNAP